MFSFQGPDKPQIFFHVGNMTTAESAVAVLVALKQLDDQATVRIDLAKRRVEIDPTCAEPAAFRRAISAAGFSSIRQCPSDRAYL